jgi:hypothetical protein
MDLVELEEETASFMPDDTLIKLPKCMRLRPLVLPVDHRATGARSGQGKCAEGRIIKKNPWRGRPKGSANKNRKDEGLSPFQSGIRAALKLAGSDLGIACFVYGGAPRCCCPAMTWPWPTRP